MLIFSLFSFSLISSFSPFVVYCEDGTVIYEGECSTPDDIWNNVKPSKIGFFDKVQLAFSNTETKTHLSAILTTEQIAYLEKSLEEGNYKEAQAAAENIRATLEKSGRYLEEFGEGTDLEYNEEFMNTGPFRDFRAIEEKWLVNTEKISEIKSEVLSRVESGEISQEEAEAILGELTGAPEEISIVIEHIEDKLIDKVVETSNGEATKLEIDYSLKYEDEQNGFENAYYIDSVGTEDIIENRFSLDTLKNEIIESKDLNFAEVENLFVQARIAQQETREALVDGDYKDARESFVEAEYLIRVLEDYTELGTNALSGINENVDKTFGEINQEIEEENKQIVADYEEAGVRDAILEKYPEYVNGLDKTYAESVSIVEIAEKIDKVEDAEIEKYSYQVDEKEAEEKVNRLVSWELAYADGVKYHPEGFVEISYEDEDSSYELTYGGGYNAKGYTYSDYSTYTDYIYGTDGYTWYSPLIKEQYVNSYPPNYEPSENIRKGDESDVLSVETDDGTYTYEYYATGYKVEKPDGTQEEHVYSDVSSQVTFLGGSVIGYNPHNYEVTYEGEVNVWNEDPEFKNYYNEFTGKVYAPEILHHDEPVYNPETESYEYLVGSTEVVFNPESNEFTIGETTLTSTVSDAAVGHEDEETYETETGEEWKYDSEEGIWKWSKINEEGVVEEGEYIPTPNNYYNYDEGNGEFIGPDGTRTTESVEFHGERWGYSDGKWVNLDNGGVYNPTDGKVYYGGHTDDGSVIFTDEQRAIIERGYGTKYKYDESGQKIEDRKYTVPGGKLVYNPSTGRPNYVSRTGLTNYDPLNPPKHEAFGADGEIVSTWVQDKDGRWKKEGTDGKSSYYGKDNYYRADSFAEIGKTVEHGGKTYFVDSELGWTTKDKNGNKIAVGPPPGQPSSEVHVRGSYYNFYSDYDSRSDRNYNYVENEQAYYYPSGVDPSSLTSEQKETYKIRDARGYDPAFGTCFGDCSAGGYNTVPSNTAVGATYKDYSGATWTKTEQGNWASSDGQTNAAPPGYSTQVYQDYGRGYGIYDTGSGYSGSYYGGGGYSASSSPYGAFAGGNFYDSKADPSSSDYDPAVASSYSSGGYYDSSGSWVGTAPTGAYDSSGAPYSSYPGGYYGSNDPAGPNYAGGTYYGGYDSSTGTSGYYSGGSYYTGGGGYDSSGNYVGGEYGGYDSSGAYTGGESYTYDSSTGTYSGTDGGSYSGGDLSGTYSGGDSGSTGGGDSSAGGDSGGGDSGGSTGAVVSDVDDSEENWFKKIWNKLFRKE